MVGIPTASIFANEVEFVVLSDCHSLFHTRRTSADSEISTLVVDVVFSSIENDKKYMVAIKKAVAILKNKEIKSKEDAIKFLKKATQLLSLVCVICRLKPDAAKAWCILGKHYQSQRNFEKSLHPLRKCFSIETTEDNKLNYGIALFDYGSIKEAKEVYESLEELKNSFEEVYNANPSNEKATYYYGLALSWVCICIPDDP